MVRSFSRAPAFWLLFTASIAATMGLAWWVVVPLTLVGLSISSLPKYIALWPRAAKAGAQGAWWRTIALSTFNSLAAAPAAFMVGNLTR